ncbi:MAG TPA: acyltransferase [Acidimicrobiia bacterium]|jgi:acetyltransferase-like isoleucine patch superfamily enzyme
MPQLPDRLRLVLGDAARGAWEWFADTAVIRSGSARARRFGAFGDSSAICFPVAALFNEEYIEIGSGTIVGPYSTISTGIMPGATGGVIPRLKIGDRCLLGKGNGFVAHESIEIGDDVFTGHHVYITDSSHGYEDVHEPIGRQFGPAKPVRVGAGSWLGHGVVVLPGTDIGRHVTVGAGSVVTGALPDFCVAVGVPARIVRRYVEDEGWVHVDHEPPAHHVLDPANVDAPGPTR